MKHTRGKRCGRVSSIDQAIAWLRLDRGGCGPTAIRLSWTAQVVSPALSVARSQVVRGAGHKQVLGEGMHDLAVGLRTPQGNASRRVARERATSTSGRAQRARARGCVRAGAARGGSRACSAQVRR